jgi:hypothetical protein
MQTHHKEKYMITVAGLLTVAIVPVVLATATFGLAVEGTESALKKAGTSVLSIFKKHPKPVVPSSPAA